MRKVLLLVCALALVFTSAAQAQEVTTPEDSAGRDQYEEPNEATTAQSIDESMEEAVDHAEKNRDAEKGAQAYIETRSPESAQAEEPEDEGSSASARYRQLPDTGGPALLPLAGGLAILLAGCSLLRKKP